MAIQLHHSFMVRGVRYVEDYHGFAGSMLAVAPLPGMASAMRSIDDQSIERWVAEAGVVEVEIGENGFVLVAAGFRGVRLADHGVGSG